MGFLGKSFGAKSIHEEAVIGPISESEAYLHAKTQRRQELFYHFDYYSLWLGGFA
jgi:hypothetical protein